jgi:cardiolipin synthase
MPTLFISILTTTTLVLHWGIVIGLGLRIILKRRARGVAIAWLFLITSVPFVGAVMYLLVGELWLPRRRIRIARDARKGLSGMVRQIEDEWELTDDQLPELARSLNAQKNAPLGLTALGGNELELYNHCQAFVDSIVRDIENAQHSVSMLFYIWESSGQILRVEKALAQAVDRGVQCRLLLDGAGSKEFLRSGRCREMRKLGIEITEALPVGLLRMLFERIDIRNHRKIAVIDHSIAYTGSMNMVDPAFFKASAGVGQWVDVMSRVRGPIARVLGLHLGMDWAVEDRISKVDHASEIIKAIEQQGKIEAAGNLAAQVVPSGPDQDEQIIHEMLITLIYNAKTRLVLTTPYFVPSESMLQAMVSAAHRGVRVSLVVPEKIDSVLVRHASRSYFQDLLEAGVELYAYKGGLLHAKTVTADHNVAMLGSVNMDLRSFSINFELSLFVYDSGFMGTLRELQASYIENSNRIEIDEWAKRSLPSRLIENTMQLMAPIL